MHSHALKESSECEGVCHVRAGKKKTATYEDLYHVPENMVGEIIHGDLIVTPRPSPTHMLSTSALGGKILPPYQFGDGGGPGGWIILVEVEIRWDEQLVVPDLAGWRKEKLPKKLEHNWIEVPPDWVCEVLSRAQRCAIAR